MSLFLLDTTTHPAVQTLPNGFRFTMIAIPAGQYTMGQGRQRITFARPFYMGQFPVTQDLYEAIMKQNPSDFKGRRRPVEMVRWFDALVFCNQLNRQCGYPMRYFMDAEFTRPFKVVQDYKRGTPIFIRSDQACYRLPSESEWEYAAAGGPDAPRFTYAGGEKLDELGWYYDNSNREIKPVGLKLPNIFDLYDMSGNVWEWCEDAWQNRENIPNDGSVNLGEPWTYRVRRGGSWNDFAGRCLLKCRFSRWPDDRHYGIGFRLAFSPQYSSGVGE